MQNVKQNTMKYKILFIFSFILLTLLLFNTNVFASFDFEHNGTVYTFNDLSDSYTYQDTIYNISDYQHRVILRNNTDFHIIFYNGDISLQYTSNDDGTFKFTSNFSSPTLTLKAYSTQSTFTPHSVSSYLNFRQCSSVLYSDVDLYDTSGTLVFQSPVPATTLAQVLVKTQEEIPELTLAEISKILILIIAVVVSLVGFRKAWKLLRTSLNQS